MNDLLEALKRHVVTDTIDLTELDSTYRADDGSPLILTVRVNWTIGMRSDAVVNQARLQNVAKEKDVEKRAKLLSMATDAVYQWWSDVLLMDADEVQEFQAWLPSEHWDWVTAESARMAREYEKETKKKANGLHSTTSEKPASADQQS